MKRIKVLTSHAANARFWAEIDDEPVYYIPRQTDIPSPYAHSPVDSVYEWNGDLVIHREVRHRRFEIFIVPLDMKVYAREDDAAYAYLQSQRATA